MNFIIMALHPEDEQMHISTTIFFIKFSALEMTSKIAKSYFAKSFSICDNLEAITGKFSALINSMPFLCYRSILFGQWGFGANEEQVTYCFILHSPSPFYSIMSVIAPLLLDSCYVHCCSPSPLYPAVQVGLDSKNG